MEKHLIVCGQPIPRQENCKGICNLKCKAWKYCLNLYTIIE